jgi:UDP-N-acetyl-2-amino-2-deoxyglucuronate dehydrogenase
MRFALIGAAGYVAPKHIQAIKDVGGELVAALDPHDSVGRLDQHFPNCLYFSEPERFDRWLSKNQLDYVSICSPNYLHDCHSLMAMRNGADVICEKPLVCYERNLDNLAEWEIKTGKKVSVILQCRLHPEAIRAKESLNVKEEWIKYLKIDYKTPRGAWYNQSWKGDVEKSGGLCTNIGIHMFDLAMWLFGPWTQWQVEEHSKTEVSGFLVLQRAEVEWTLSVNPGEPKRIFSINKDKIDLTTGFADLHTETYRQILSGNGFGIEDIRPATRLTEAIRNVCQ